MIDRMILAAALTLGTVATAHAAGFALMEQGARALGTAGAFTAVANDPSAIYWNAAGVARLTGTRVYAGISPVVPELEFSGTGPYPGYGVTERWREQVMLPAHAYVTFPLVRGIVGGVGVHVPYGLRSEWQNPDDFTGRYLSTKAEVRATHVNPTVAIELTPRLSLGVGASLVLADANLERRVPVLIPDGTVVPWDLAALSLDGETTPGFTWNVGALYDIGRFRFGAAYRHSVETTIEGDATFTFNPIGVPDFDAGLAAEVPPDQRAEADVPFPAHASVGMAVRLGERWNAAVDAAWTGWSIFEELPVRFDDAALSQTTVENYDDTWSVHAGLTYQASEKLALRGGGYVDETPVPDASVGPLLPDARRYGLTGGLGYAYESWRVDLFEMLVIFDDREVRGSRDGFDGDYAERAWVFGVSVGYTRW